MVLDFTDLLRNHREAFNNGSLNKSNVRNHYLIDFCARHNLQGNSFWMAGDSTEIIDYLQCCDNDPQSCWNAEYGRDPELHKTYYNWYLDNLAINMAPVRERIHKTILSIPDNTIVYGHADFYGLIGSVGNYTATYTFELLKNLKVKLADEAYIAFTHFLVRRSASILLNQWSYIYNTFIVKNSNWCGDLISYLYPYRHHPLLLLCLKADEIMGDEFKITPVDSFDYPSTTGYGSGTNSMNKTVIKFERGINDPEEMIDAFIETKEGCRSIKKAA